MIQKTLASGGEGGVIIHKDSKYQPGKRSTKVSLKIKKELQDTIDCFFTGRVSSPARDYTGKDIENWKYWENIRTGKLINAPMFNEYYKGEPYEPVTKSYYMGMAGSLEIGVYQNNKIKPIGYLSGLSEEIKMNHDKYKMRVIEVTAMQLTDDIAASLEAVLGIPARFWHKLEAEYRDAILKVNAENAKTDGKIAGKWVPNNYGTLKAAEV